jgi:hypothetical protein
VEKDQCSLILFHLGVMKRLLPSSRKDIKPFRSAFVMNVGSRRDGFAGGGRIAASKGKLLPPQFKKSRNIQCPKTPVCEFRHQWLNLKKIKKRSEMRMTALLRQANMKNRGCKLRLFFYCESSFLLLRC